MNLLITFVISFLFGMSICSQNVTIVGNTEILVVEKSMPFYRAEKKCKERGSNLIEFWSEDEWKEVIREKFMLVRQSRMHHDFSSFCGQGRETILLELDGNMDFGLDWLIEVRNITKSKFISRNARVQLNFQF